MIRLLRRKSRLLVLDDDPSMQRLVATLLRRAGYEVDIVSGGTDAIAQIAKHDYDGLLLDVMTPTEGAHTVVRHLRETRPELLRRVILVTGSPDSVLKSLAGDVFAVVHKPFEAAELLDAVARIKS